MSPKKLTGSLIGDTKLLRYEKKTNGSKTREVHKNTKTIGQSHKNGEFDSQTNT